VAAREPALRVLQVASSLYEWGGIERYVVYLATGLTERGHQVEITCPPGSPISERVPGTHALTMRRKLDLRGFAAYLRLFRANRYDVVHGHFSPDFTLPAYAARMTRQPLTVMTRHLATHWSQPKARAYSRLWNRIIPVSHAVERRLAENGVPPGQMVVAKAGSPAPTLKSARADVRDDLMIADHQFALGSFGRLVPEKGVEVLLGALPELSGVRVCVFGSGPSEIALKQLADERKLQPRVTFHGQVADVADAMASMDAVVIPSTWEEPFPYAALEAMALGRPIIASRIGGLPEVVQEGVTGTLFNPGDSADLAGAIGRLMADRQAAEAMGRRGRELHRAEYTVERMAERIEAAYRLPL